jgi:ABC-type antimicrobial peptide transport system permease subunit
VLFLLAVALAMGTNVLYRSVLLQREIATRRVLGARRSHIVAMFLLESIPGVSIGILFGAAAVVLGAVIFSDPFSLTSILISTVMLLCSGAVGGWLAARHASKHSLSQERLVLRRIR